MPEPDLLYQASILDNNDDEIGWPIRHRSWTRDVDTIGETFSGDEYRLRHSEMQAAIYDAVIIDAGANIGCVSSACLALGARHVLAIEPEVENRAVLARNLDRWQPGRYSILDAAVGDPAVAPFVNFAETGPSARMEIEPIVRLGVPVLSLSEVLGLALGHGDHVGLLKVDVEGAEWDWLLAAEEADLARIDRISMEWHPFRPGSTYTPSLFGTLCERLAYTHSISAFGRPDTGGLLYAHPYRTPRTST